MLPPPPSTFLSPIPASKAPTALSPETTARSPETSPADGRTTPRGPIPTDAAGTLLTADHPASAGSVIVVYLTGIGSLTNTPLDGAGAPLAPLAQATLSATATIGRANPTLPFLGAPPHFAGLAQANLQVPQLAAGDYPVVITVNGVASAPAMLSVATRSPLWYIRIA